MVQIKRETLGKTPTNKAVDLRTEEEEEPAQESTQNEGVDAKQISIEVEAKQYTDQTGGEKAEVDQKVAGATKANEINREDESTVPIIPEKMVPAKNNRNKNAAKVVVGTESAGSLAAETVDVDRFAGDQKSAVIVADKPRNEEYVEGEPKKEVIVDSIQIIGKSEQKCVPKAKLEMENKILEVAKAGESTAKKVELQQNESENEVEVIVKTETKQKLSEKMEIDEMVEKKIENEESEGKRKKSKERKQAKKVKGEPQTVQKILEVGKADESTVKKVELQQNESEKEIEVTVKTETEQKLSEKIKNDEMVEKKIENEQSEGKRKKSKRRKRAKIVKGGEVKSEQKCVPKVKLEMESPQMVKKILEVAKVDESTVKKVELQQQNESEKEIEVTVKTGTMQKLSEKMEIDVMVDQKIENEQSEGKRKKIKKWKRKKKAKGGELKKITEEEGEVRKITQEEEGEVKTMKVDGTVEKNPQNDQSEGKRKKSKKKKRAKNAQNGELKKITEEKGEAKKIIQEDGEVKKIREEEGEVKKITQEEGELKTMKVDGTVEKNLDNDQSKKRNGANIEKGGQLKKTRQEETATEDQQTCNAIEVIEMLVDSLTKDELLEVVKSTALEAVGFSAHVDSVASRDELKRTICVTSLGHGTNSEMLRNAFLQYGQIENAVVVVDEESGRSRGFGFVVFTTKSSALSAVRHPVQKIDGQWSHCLLSNAQRNRSLNSYTAIPRPGEYVNPETHGPGGFFNPTVLALGEYVDRPVFGPRVNSTFYGHLNPEPVFGPRVNSTFYGHLNPQAALGDFQSPNQWGDSDLQYEYTDSQYNENNHVKRCDCGSIYCDL